MKKTIVAGAAGIALAVMPAVGAFATTQTVPITDTLSATITSACTFVRYGEAGAAGQTGVETSPAWSGATSGAADMATGTYSATFKPGSDVELGTSHFTGYCNDEHGFTVTVATPALSNGAATPSTLPFLTSAPSATSEGYVIFKDASTQFTNTGSDTVFMSASGPTDSSSAVSADAIYTVYTNTNTKSGTYTGNVVYTFTYDDPTSTP